jgi:hypothetical protein
MLILTFAIFHVAILIATQTFWQWQIICDSSNLQEHRCVKRLMISATFVTRGSVVNNIITTAADSTAFIPFAFLELQFRELK